ncbi:MAG: SurA N-terminal domain-containing protein [Syntrophobacteraceae bacterium]|nr:SurA N-terminal domain-containing protein [Syntrophobacteraceae bacterium]
MNLLQRTGTLVFCTILAVVLCLGTARAEVVDRIVANVDGQIILYSDLQTGVALLKRRMPSLDLSDPGQKSKIEREVLEQLIAEKLADSEAKRLHITVGDQEVEARIQQLMSMNHVTREQLKQKLTANGDSLEHMSKQIKESIARQQLMQRVLKSQVVITEQEIDAYMNAHEGQVAQEAQEATAPGKVHLALIVLPGSSAAVKKTGLKLVKELQGGADFRTLAIRYSKGPAAQDGGDVGYMAPEDVAPFIAKAIQGLKNGQVSDLAQGPDGYYIVKMLDLASGHTSTTGSVSREKAREILYEQAMAHKYEQWIKGLESKAFIQISL